MEILLTRIADKNKMVQRTACLALGMGMFVVFVLFVLCFSIRDGDRLLTYLLILATYF
jgi:hypothetical protein